MIFMSIRCAPQMLTGASFLLSFPCEQSLPAVPFMPLSQVYFPAPHRAPLHPVTLPLPQNPGMIR